MEYMFAAGPFVKVVDILCNNLYVEILFKLGQPNMTSIGPGVIKFFPALVVKTND